MVLILGGNTERIQPLAFESLETSQTLSSQLEQAHKAAWSWALTCCAGDRAKAEDALQTSYLKVLEGRARWQGDANFQTFLFAVIRNTAKDSYRGPWANRRASLDDESMGPVLTSPQKQADPFARDRLQKALFQLPERPRQILSLLYGHGYTLKEAAKLLDIAPGSAASHLHRAKKQLRTLLGVESEELS